MSLRIVLLPAPLRPTSARVSPAGMRSVNPRRMGADPREAWTSSKAIAGWPVISVTARLYRKEFWSFGVLGFWGFGVLGFWGFGVLGSGGRAFWRCPESLQPQNPQNFNTYILQNPKQ